MLFVLDMLRYITYVLLVCPLKTRHIVSSKLHIDPSSAIFIIYLCHETKHVLSRDLSCVTHTCSKIVAAGSVIRDSRLGKGARPHFEYIGHILHRL